MSKAHSPWWLRYGSLGQIAQATVALLGFVAILVQINVLGKNAHEAGARQSTRPTRRERLRKQ
jgi:hypothetical protein